MIAATLAAAVLAACPAEDQPDFFAMSPPDRQEAIDACEAETEAAAHVRRVRTVPIEMGIGATLVHQSTPVLAATVRLFGRLPFGATLGVRAWAGTVFVVSGYGAGGSVGYTFDTPWEMRVTANADWAWSHAASILGGSLETTHARGSLGYELLTPSGAIGFGVEVGVAHRLSGFSYDAPNVPSFSTTITWYFL